MDGVRADLEWRLNTSLSIGPWAVEVSPDLTRGRLCDVGTLEALRETHDWDPVFTLRFADDATIDVAVGRPGDDGTFTLADAEHEMAREAGTPAVESPGGVVPEPGPVADATTWLHEQGFAGREHARSGKLSGSRLFDRQDGWRVRYSCTFGTWSVEVAPPAHQRFTSLRPDDGTSWRDALRAVIDGP
jgi:hypothetical protein